MDFDHLREKFRGLYDAVAKGHRESKRAHHGHGLDHDVTVAMLAVRIAPDKRTAEKAFCAALLHSTDRLVEKGNKHDVETHVRVCLAQLPPDYFSFEEIEEIVAAVLRHSELNREDQSLTQQVLMDADRLANLMVAVVIRAGQFQPDIPAFEFEHLASLNPASTYAEPKSVLDDLRQNIREYLPQMRLPKAKKLAKVYATRLLAFINQVTADYRKLKLVGVNL